MVSLSNKFQDHPKKYRLDKNLLNRYLNIVFVLKYYSKEFLNFNEFNL